MTFRLRLFTVFAVTVVVAVGAVSWVVSVLTRRAFERIAEQRITALVGQFRREFAQRRDEIARRIERIAATDSMLEIAVKMNHPQRDYGPFVNEAQALAGEHGLDFLELIDSDGAIISSAQWPARFGYKEDWITETADWNARGAFLKKEQLTNETALALVAVRVATAGDKKLYIAGGQRLDQKFLESLVLPAGMRALLYSGLEPDLPPEVTPLIEQLQKHGREVTGTTLAETFHAIPLLGQQNELLGALLVGSSRRELADLERSLVWTAVLVAAGGILLGLLLSLWSAARVSRSVEELSVAAGEVAAGKWSTRAPVHTRDEIGKLAQAFNRMTEELADQRDRLVQAERVAAWRELARRLAHELKNPLFPLQITIENMQRARDRRPQEFEEVFEESTSTLLAGLDNLKRIVSRFSDFARMPHPELAPVELNELVRNSMKLFEAQFDSAGITSQLELDPKGARIAADADQMSRVLQNLLLNAVDAMPSGGVVTVRTQQGRGTVTLQVSDTGQGLTQEECERLFTPYYTTKAHGTGLGLAIVQSIVSDHQGRISVESERGRGTTIRIELDLDGQ